VHNVHRHCTPRAHHVCTMHTYTSAQRAEAMRALRTSCVRYTHIYKSLMRQVMCAPRTSCVCCTRRERSTTCTSNVRLALIKCVLHKHMQMNNLQKQCVCHTHTYKRTTCTRNVRLVYIMCVRYIYTNIQVHNVHKQFAPPAHHVCAIRTRKPAQHAHAMCASRTSCVLHT
jgi:hypothetical protein